MKNKFDVEYSLQLTIDEIQFLESLIESAIYNPDVGSEFEEEQIEMFKEINKKLISGLQILCDMHDLSKKYE